MSKLTDKLIDDIIELILEDMGCYHEDDGTYISVEYNLNNEKKLRGMLGELIEQAREKLTVSKAFIGKVTARIYCDRKSVRAIKTNVREALEEVGVEVEE